MHQRRAGSTLIRFLHLVQRGVIYTTILIWMEVGMTWGPAPDLPEFIAKQFSFSRRAWTFEEGPQSGATISLVDDGNRVGMPLIFIHGNPTWSFLWRKVIEGVDHGKFRCIAPDLLGLGCSSKKLGVSEHSLQVHIDALVTLIEAMELPEFILVGQDWGGPCVTGVGARLGERVKGVVLANTSVLVPKRPHGTAFHRFSRIPGLSDFVFRGLGLPQRLMGMVQGERNSIRGEVSKAYVWPLRGIGVSAAPLALARMVPDSMDHPSIPHLEAGQKWLRNFKGPMALVWGSRDPILGRALPKHREAFPDAFVIETEAGHFLQEEVPEELVRAIEWVWERIG